MIIGIYRAQGLGIVIVESEEENKRKWKMKRILRFSRNDKKSCMTLAYCSSRIPNVEGTLGHAAVSVSTAGRFQGYPSGCY